MPFFAQNVLGSPGSAPDPFDGFTLYTSWHIHCLWQLIRAGCGSSFSGHAVADICCLQQQKLAFHYFHNLLSWLELETNGNHTPSSPSSFTTCFPSFVYLLFCLYMPGPSHPMKVCREKGRIRSTSLSATTILLVILCQIAPLMLLLTKLLTNNIRYFVKRSKF